MVNDTVNKIESLLGQEMTAEDRLEVELWERGRNLANVPPHSWDEIDEMLAGYVTREADDLIATEPKDFEAVRAQHAVAHAAARLYKRFVEDRNTALAAKAPAVVRHAAQQASQVPPESI